MPVKKNILARKSTGNGLVWPWTPNEEVPKQWQESFLIKQSLVLRNMPWPNNNSSHWHGPQNPGPAMDIYFNMYLCMYNLCIHSKTWITHSYWQFHLQCVQLDLKIQNWVCKSCVALDNCRKQAKRWNMTQFWGTWCSISFFRLIFPHPVS